MVDKSAESRVQHTVQVGFTDGKKYEENIPSYQDEAVQEVMRMLLSERSNGEGCEYDVLELGAGTGKFTRKLLVSLPEGTKILVSEPMSDFLATLQSSVPEAKTAQFAAKSIPLPDKSVQAIVAAQSFHWFADKESMDEITRVLKPGGNFVMVWNIMDDDKDSGIVRAFYDLSLQWRGGFTQYIDKVWEKELFAYEGLYVVERKNVKFKKEYTEEGFINYLSTFSYINRMSEDEKKSAQDTLRTMIRTHPDTKNREKFDIPFFHDILHCREKKT